MEKYTNLETEILFSKIEITAPLPTCNRRLQWRRVDLQPSQQFGGRKINKAEY
jgi:hypothetical protein